MIFRLEIEIKEEYDEKAYGSVFRGSSGAALQQSNVQNLPGLCSLKACCMS